MTVPPTTGGVLVGLEDDGVAQGEGGGDRLQGQQEGEVERADHADDADRDAVEPVLLAGVRGGDQAVLGARREAHGLTQELLGEVQFEGGLHARAAQFGDDRLGELRLPVLDQPQHLLQDGAAGVRPGRGPVPLGAGGGAVGLIYLVDRGYGDRGQLLTVVGVDVDDVPGTGARAPLAVDVLLSQVGEVGRHVTPRSPRYGSA
ncbi:hypothetical protein GCM10020295_35350 [Streptomyces cinereospinus]